MTIKKPIKRKVVCVFGEWGKKTDFVLEPYSKGDEKEEDVLGKAFWIQECKE